MFLVACLLGAPTPVGEWCLATLALCLLLRGTMLSFEAHRLDMFFGLNLRYVYGRYYKDV